MNSVKSNNLNMIYLRFLLSWSKDVGILKFEFVAKTQILCTRSMNHELCLFIHFIPTNTKTVLKKQITQKTLPL